MYCMMRWLSDVVSWAGLFLLGSVVVDGARGSSGGVQVSVHLVCVVCVVT